MQKCIGEKETIPGQLQQFTGRSFLKKGEHSFPYTNSVKSEYNICLNYCVELI